MKSNFTNQIIKYRYNQNLGYKTKTIDHTKSQENHNVNYNCTNINNINENNQTTKSTKNSYLMKINKTKNYHNNIDSNLIKIHIPSQPIHTHNHNIDILNYIYINDQSIVIDYNLSNAELKYVTKYNHVVIPWEYISINNDNNLIDYISSLNFNHEYYTYIDKKLLSKYSQLIQNIGLFVV
jgi:hypothetical protein